MLDIKINKHYKEIEQGVSKMNHSSQGLANNNQSTDKVLAILELLSYSEEPLRLIDIAHKLQFNTSTSLRFLNSLEQNGYI